jgi:hypothetical protein
MRDTTEGLKECFQCKYEKCKRKCYILYNSDSLTVSLWYNDQDRNHEGSKEKIVMGINKVTKAVIDSAPAIHNGFKSAFKYYSIEEFSRVMCWSHVERNCETKSCGIEETTRQEVLLAIKYLQVMPSSASFNHALKLFFDKWASNSNIASF